MELREYEMEDGRVPFREWLEGLRDREARARIRARLGRIRLGNLGDAKSVGQGVSELRIHHGPGYRIYFGRDGEALVLLLLGGDKSTQDADIRRAQSYWRDYLRRNE
jgi:putative addiction module killer protein